MSLRDASSFALLPDPNAGCRVVALPANVHAFRAYTSPPPVLSFDAPTARCEVEAVTLYVKVFVRAERMSRRERRQQARVRGRRRAVPVPVETRWGIRLAVHPDVAPDVARRFMAEHAEVTERIWARRERG